MGKKLENNPISNGIVIKTKKVESTINFKETIFLEETEKEGINCKISIEMNEWLNNLLRAGKRKHGKKITKEIWLQAALELLRAMPITWEDIESEDELKNTLSDLESRINRK